MASILFPMNLNIEKARPFVLEGLATDFVLHRLVREEGQASCFWLQTRKGSGQVMVSGQTLAVAAGQGAWINQGHPFELVAGPEGWTVDWLALSGTGVDGLVRSNPDFSQPAVFHLADEAVLHDRFTLILETAHDLSRSASDRHSMEAYALVLEISEQISDRPLTGRGIIREQRLKPVLDHIAMHFREAITLEALAKVMGVTPQHLCTVFRKLMGLRIFEYINQVRIQASKADLIDHPEKSVKAVANACGFDDVSYFCSIFKRFEKVTPGDFRKLYHA